MAGQDRDGDGDDEIIVGSGAGTNGHVKVFTGGSGLASADVNGDGVADAVLDFFAYDPAFRGGANVAAGDVNGDGRDDIITAPASRGFGHVKVFSGADAQPTRSFFAFEGFLGGFSVDTADVNGDRRPDIIVTASDGRVQAHDGASLAILDSLT